MLSCCDVSLDPIYRVAIFYGAMIQSPKEVGLTERPPSDRAWDMSEILVTRGSAKAFSEYIQSPRRPRQYA